MSADLRLVVFFLELPEPLPIVDGSTVTVMLEEPLPELGNVNLQSTRNTAPILSGARNLFVSFRFWQVDASELPGAGFSEATARALRRIMPEHLRPRAETQMSAPRPWGYVTVVEGVTPLVRASGEDSATRELSEAFDRCEEQLTKLIDAYRAFKHSDMPPLRRELLPAAVPFITRDAFSEDGWAEGMSLFLLHLNLPVHAEMLDSAELEKVLLFRSHQVSGNPFAIYGLRSTEARAALQRYGNTADAVIRAQMSFEVLMDGLLAWMLWEEGLDPVGAADRFFGEGLSKRVRTHFAGRLGGNWSTKGSGSIAQWKESVHALRGRVLHGNYVPTRAEARRALEVMTDVESFVRERLIAKRNKYKRTTLMFFGRPGLERMGGWSAEIRRFVEREAGSESSWLDSFRAWRERLNAAR